MASTRDKNSPANYKLEKLAIQKTAETLMFENNGNAHVYKPAFPEFYSPSFMTPDILSHNFIEIDSNLKGIGSNNLENPKSHMIAKLKTLPNVSFFDRQPLIMPVDLSIEHNQRPNLS